MRQHQAKRIRPETEETGMAERDVAGVAAHDVPRGREPDVHHREDRDVRGRRIRRDDRESQSDGENKHETRCLEERRVERDHHSRSRTRTPYSPWGRTSSTSTRTTKKTKR